MSCVVMQEEKGQTPVEHIGETQIVTEINNFADYGIRGTSGGDSRQCTVNRKEKFLQNRRREASVYMK